MAVLSPPQHRAGTGLTWGTFPMERPCSSISRPSLGWGGACNHPRPTCMSVRGTLAKCPVASRPAPASVLPQALPSHSTGSTFPCQAPAGCCLMPVPSAHQQGSRRLPKGGMGQQRDSDIAGEEKSPASHSRTCSGSGRKQAAGPNVAQGTAI